MDGSTAKQNLLLDMDKIIYWRHGVLEVDPQNDENSRALKQLLTIREAVCAMKESDREFHRLGALLHSAQLDGTTDRMRDGQIGYLKTYGTVLEPALDPYSFVQDLIIELSAITQWSHLAEASSAMRGGTAMHGH